MPLGASRLSLLALPQVVEAAAPRQALDGIVVNGCELQTAQKKFGTTSAHFDGIDDYFYVPKNTQNVDFSGDFTLELWFRKDSTAGNTKLFDLRGINAAHTGADTVFALGDTLLIDVNGSSVRVYIDGASRASTTTITANTWHHLAVQRSSGTFNAWFDGTRFVDYAGSDDYTTVFAANQAVGAGASSGTLSQLWPGYMDEIRWSTVARYTNGASITTPTSAFTDDDDTYVLLHLDGLDGSIAFNDDAPRTAIGVTAYNNAQVDTAQSEYGGASLYLDGSDDYLEIDGSTFMNDFANGPEFTVEYWVRPQSTSGFETHFGNWGGSSTRCFFLGSNNGTTIAFYWTDTGDAIDTTVTAGSALTRNAWNHVALVGTATEFKLYTNGVLRDSGTREDIRAQAELTKIGASATLAEDFLGHIDELRVSKVARYTGSTYTQPTSAFTNDYDTVLLLHMDGADASTTFTDDNT